MGGYKDTIKHDIHYWKALLEASLKPHKSGKVREIKLLKSHVDKDMLTYDSVATMLEPNDKQRLKPRQEVTADGEFLCIVQCDEKEYIRVEKKWIKSFRDHDKEIRAEDCERASLRRQSGTQFSVM